MPRISRYLSLSVSTAGALVLLGSGLLASEADAAPIQCGDVITETVKLKADLTDCPDDGLVVGADRITINLKGHEVSSDCEPADCAGRVGIDNSGGHDRVRIRNGTVRGFEQNILLERANRNTLAKLEVRGGRYIDHYGSNSLVLDHSHRNVIKGSDIGGGDPGILLTASDHNKFARSLLGGGIAIRVGGGIHMLEGSDANTVTRSEVSGEGGAMLIQDSVRNLVKKSSLGAQPGAIYLTDADRTLIVGNKLDGGQGWAVRARGNRNTIRDNDSDGIVTIMGDRNLAVGNRLEGGFFASSAIRVEGGDRNVVRSNDAAGSYEAPVIWTLAATSRTSVVGNSASGGEDVFEPGSGDGIRVDALGTLIRGNTATDNDALGINAVDGVIDGGNNHAAGNGDPRQCVGVVCTP